MKHQCQSQFSPEHALPEVHGSAGCGTRKDEQRGSVSPRLALMRTRTYNAKRGSRKLSEPHASIGIQADPV